VSGFWSGVAAFTIWGLVPLYWKLLKHVPAIQVLGHRIVWSLAVLIIVVAAMRRGWRDRDAVGDHKAVAPPSAPSPVAWSACMRSRRP
jgi:RarD protein